MEPRSIILDIPEPKNLAEKQLQEYIIKSLVENGKCALLPFIFQNTTMMETAKHYLFHKTASPGTFSTMTYVTSRFCKWIGKNPDQIIDDCLNQKYTPQTKAIIQARQKIDEYIFFLRERKISSSTVYVNISKINAFFTINRVNLNLNFRLRRDYSNRARAVTIEELQKILQVADLREKVIVAILAVSGLRTNTLVRLQYRHVKRDLENRIFPVHIAIEPQITKGKYQGYSTFINRETAEYLIAYLNARRKGTAFIAPENIQNESPLIRISKHGKVESIPTQRLGDLLRSLFFKSEVLIKRDSSNIQRYELNPNSFRKFFRSQMSVLGVQQQFIEYMMGHKTDLYLDVKMAGIEYLRRVYNLSGISLTQEKGFDRYALLKQAIERLDFKPQEVLKPEIIKKMNYQT